MNYTNEQLRELLAANGKPLTAAQMRAISDRQQEAVSLTASEYEAIKPTAPVQQLSALERALLTVPSIVNMIHDIGSTLTTITQALIPSVLPILLILLIFAEAERVRYGVLLFETHGYLASIVAYILVFGNVFLELAIQYRHQAHGGDKAPRYQWSLATFARWLGYKLGLGKNWQPRPQSPAAKLEQLQATLTAAILFLAVSGSMQSAVERAQGNWRQGLVSIMRDSSLSEMLVWLSGLVSAVVIVLLAQQIVAYSYQRASEYYADLLERKRAVSGNAHLDEWQQQRAAAIEQARQQAERELLIAQMGKLGLPTNGYKMAQDPKPLAGELSPQPVEVSPN